MSEPAIRLLAQEYLDATRPGTRLDDLSWEELCCVLGDDFVAWRDAHPNRELVCRRLREQWEEENRIFAELGIPSSPEDN